MSGRHLLMVATVVGIPALVVGLAWCRARIIDRGRGEWPENVAAASTVRRRRPLRTDPSSRQGRNPDSTPRARVTSGRRSCPYRGGQ